MEKTSNISDRFNGVVWVVRACYIAALVIIAVICLKFYFEQETNDKKVSGIQDFWQQLNKTNYAAEAFQIKALKISNELDARNKSEVEFASNSKMSTHVNVLNSLREKTRSEVAALKAEWNKLPPELAEDIKASSRFMAGDKPLRHFETLGNSGRMVKVKSQSELYWYCREITSVFENQTQVSTRHIVSKIEQSQRRNFQSKSAMLQQFLLITIVCLALIGLLVFLPIDLFIRRMLANVAEKTRIAEEQRQMASLADRAKSEFLANMSHEIRTPMNGVMGMAELLMKTDLNDKQRTFAEIIVKSGSALLTIINDILDFSKIDAGQMELDPAPFNLEEAIEDVAALVSTKIKEKDLELVVRVSPDMPANLIGDVGRIRQIVTNLVGNSVKFTETGHILIEANCDIKENKAAICITIEDTGIGIREDKLKKIFEKFSQVDESATRKHEGTGLGLAIASSLVHLMGGRINVESTEGLGSKFWFDITLPIDGKRKSKPVAAEEISGARVFVVDDNAVNRKILLENMENWGFDSAAAASGEEAMAILEVMAERQIAIDCLVLDYQMPNISGVDLAKQVRNHSALAKTPIVMLTSVDQMDDGKHFSELDIQGHLVKPARSSLLFEIVCRAIQENRSNNTQDSPGIEMARTIGALSPVETDQTDSVTELSVPEPEEQQDQASPDPALHDDATPQETMAVFDDTLASEIAEPEQLDILVAEDNEVNRVVFTQILETMDLNFQIVENGRLAVDAYLRMNPKVICMDVSMPVLNGLEATREIRQIEETVDRHTPIIGVTAHAITGDRDKCIEAGMDDYLSKPVSPKLLEEKIRKWLDSQSQEQTAARIQA